MHFKWRAAIGMPSVLFVSIPIFAQEPVMKKAIAPEIFYTNALHDQAPIASFQSVADALTAGEVVLLDLRSPEEFAAEHLQGAINLPATELTDEALAAVIPAKDSNVVIYCANNLQMTRRVALTTLAYPVLKQLGYTRVSILESSFAKRVEPLTTIAK